MPSPCRHLHHFLPLFAITFACVLACVCASEDNFAITNDGTGNIHIHLPPDSADALSLDSSHVDNNHGPTVFMGGIDLLKQIRRGQQMIAQAPTVEKLYVIGGRDIDDGEAVADVHALVDIARPHPVWAPVTLPSLPDGRDSGVAIVFRGRLMVLGGREKHFGVTLNTVFTFDGEVWTSGPAMPQPRHRFGAAVVDDRLYVYGGYQSQTDTHLDSVDVFDGETWTSEVATMQAPRISCAYTAYRGHAYAIGGYRQATDATITMNTVESFNGTAWTLQPPLLRRVYGGAAAVFADRIFVTGGGRDGLYNFVQVFDSQGWNLGPALPQPTYLHVAAVFENRLYVIGGSNGTVVGDVFFLSEPEATSWTRAASLPIPRIEACGAVYTRPWP